MVDFKKMLEESRKNRLELDAEAERLRQDPGPPLEAKRVDGMQDSTKKVGVLCGTPTKLHDGWGVSIHPTRQQKALLDERRREYEATGAYDEGYMKGLPAVSIDKSGRVRSLTIRDASYGWSFDMYGNSSIRCRTSPREPDRAGGRKPLRQGGDPEVRLPARRPRVSAGGPAGNRPARAVPTPGRS